MHQTNSSTCSRADFIISSYKSRYDVAMKKGRISMERALARTPSRRGLLTRLEQLVMPRQTASRSEEHWWNLPPLTT